MSDRILLKLPNEVESPNFGLFTAVSIPENRFPSKPSRAVNYLDGMVLGMRYACPVNAIAEDVNPGWTYSVCCTWGMNLREIARLDQDLRQMQDFVFEDHLAICCSQDIDQCERLPDDVPMPKFQLFDRVQANKRFKGREATVVGLCWIDPVSAIAQGSEPGWVYSISHLFGMDAYSAACLSREFQVIEDGVDETELKLCSAEEVEGIEIKSQHQELAIVVAA